MSYVCTTIRMNSCYAHVSKNFKSFDLSMLALYEILL